MTSLTDFSYEYIKSSMLSRIPDTIDKREGSIIYDTTMPVAKELEVYYAQLSEIQRQAYAQTATGGFLDLIVAEAGIKRNGATYAQKKIVFTDDANQPMFMALGNRFSTVSSDTPIIYKLTEPYKDGNGVVVGGSYIAVCETLGTIGNGYTGNVLPVTFVSSLTSAIMSTTILPAEDEEDDETLRARFFEKVNRKAFGGNISQYKEYFEEIEGVGGVQIYPTWSGGGTVKCSIIDTSFNPCSTEFITTVQNLIDPLAISGTATTGAGIGYAPIGHKVTVVTPTEVNIAFTANITLASGFTAGQVTPLITTALTNFINTIKETWDVGNNVNEYSVHIYLAKVLSVIIAVNGVDNVTNVKINGSATDLTLTQTGATQQLPKFASATITVV